MAMILIDVFTPGNGKTYEFQLDDTITIESAKAQMVEEIILLEEHGITFQEPTLLSDLESKRILSNQDPLYAVGVKSGHTLLLV